MADEQQTSSAVADPEEFSPTQKISKKTPRQKSEDDKETLDELNAEIDANFRMCTNASAPWIEAAKEDILFKAGSQWDEADKVILQQEKRPCLTFNIIKPVVKLLTGHFIQNSARIQVSPEGGEDEIFSEVADKLIDFIDRQAKLDFNLGYTFEGGQTCGRAWIEFYIDYEKDPIFGELKSLYHGRPGVIYVDPRGEAYDINEDRAFLFKLVRKSKKELKEKYPDKENEIDAITTDSENPDITPAVEGGPNNYGANKNRSRLGLNVVTPEAGLITEDRNFHVKEYWRYEYVDKWFVYFLDNGDLLEFDKESDCDKEIETRRNSYVESAGDPEKWAPIKKKRQRKQMHVAIRCGGKILANGLSPHEPYYSGFPFFQYIADWTPEAEHELDQIQGIVRCMKDPQREKNKARSQFLHIINSAANSGWVADEDALDTIQEDQIKTFGSTPGILIKKKSGSQLTRIEPVPAPVAQQIREKSADDSVKLVTGVNSDLLALDTNTNPSGKAIALRIRQAITILETDFRNFRYTKELIGTFLMKILPTQFDVPKIKKILGAAYIKNNPEVTDSFLKMFLIMVEDKKYHVRVAEQGDTKTLREETFEDLMNMLQNGMPIPFDVMADYMTMPNKAEVIAKVQQEAARQQQMALAAASAKSGAKAGAGNTQAASPTAPGASVPTGGAGSMQ